jgi:hypothetical protein
VLEPVAPGIGRLEADHVEASRNSFCVVIIRQKQESEYNRQDTGRQVNEEKPMPGRVLENGSRNDRAEDWPQQNGYRRVTNNAHKMLARDAHQH